MPFGASLAIHVIAERVVVVAPDAMPGVVAHPLDDFGRLRAEVHEVAQAPDLVGVGFRVGHGQECFVVAVEVGDDEDFHFMRGASGGRETEMMAAPTSEVAITNPHRPGR